MIFLRKVCNKGARFAAVRGFCVGFGLWDREVEGG